MDSDQRQGHGLTDFWQEPWTASTWGTWSNQNPASQGLSASSWMYTSHASNHGDSDESLVCNLSFSSDVSTSYSSPSSIPSPGSPSAFRQQPWLAGSSTNNNNNNNNSSNSNNNNVDHHCCHHHYQHHHHRGAVSPANLPMTPPPGLSPQRFGIRFPTGLRGVSGGHPHPSLPVARALVGGSRAGTSRSSSIDSESSALGFGGPCAFQISGYRTVELLPTAQQRQTLQKWFGVVRWTHNRAVDALRVDPSASAACLRAAVAEAEAEHEWAAAVPLAIRDATVAQLVGALHLAQRSAEVAAAATGESIIAEPIGTAAQNKALKYRTRKDRLEQVVLRADGFQYGIPYPDYFGYAPLASSAPIPDPLNTDAILVRSTERFYLCIPDSC